LPNASVRWNVRVPAVEGADYACYAMWLLTAFLVTSVRPPAEASERDSIRATRVGTPPSTFLPGFNLQTSKHNDRQLKIALFILFLVMVCLVIREAFVLQEEKGSSMQSTMAGLGAALVLYAGFYFWGTRRFLAKLAKVRGVR
jgi:fucose 4-O-acetylase-like acetyltransferase